MRRFLSFVVKEFAHVLRDPKTLLVLFGLPVVQILIFGFALSNEVKNSRLVVVDRARDEASRRLLDRIEASRYFETVERTSSEQAVEAAFRSGSARLAVIIPSGFADRLGHDRSAPLQVIADASDPNIASTLTHYVTAIVRDFERSADGPQGAPFVIVPEVRMLYNPQLESVHNFVPGVMALVLMLVCVMMTAISIVREKELGTMEVLLVSPFRPSLVVVSKAIPYLTLSLVNIVSILSLSVFVLKLPVNGSLALLFLESVLFIVTCLALGLLISVRTASQQVAMLISLMGMLLPTLLFSGFMFPIENMPWPLQLISNIVPAKWYYLIVKDIMIKGVGFAAVWKETLILAGITAALTAIAIRNFKIRLE